MTESPNVEVSCITHRRSPIYQAFISQMPPSESSAIRKIAYEQNILQHLQGTNINDVREVALHEAGSSMNLLVIQLNKTNRQEPFQAMYAALGYAAQVGKVTIAVDEDINPHNLESVVWAVTTRTQPNRDISILKNRKGSLDPSSAVRRNERSDLSIEGVPVNVDHPEDSAVIIDATMEWDYPPTSLPSKEFMELGIELWEDLGLPSLSLRDPWYGRSHGDWSETLETAAQRAVRGEYMDYSFEDLITESERSGD